MSFELEDEGISMFSNLNDIPKGERVSINLLYQDYSEEDIEINVKDKVQTLIDIIARDRGVTKDKGKVILSMAGRTLKGEKTFEKEKVESDSRIQVIIRVRGGKF